MNGSFSRSDNLGFVVTLVWIKAVRRIFHAPAKTQSSRASVCSRGSDQRCHYGHQRIDCWANAHWSLTQMLFLIAPLAACCLQVLCEEPSPARTFGDLGTIKATLDNRQDLSARLGRKMASKPPLFKYLLKRLGGGVCCSCHYNLAPLEGDCFVPLQNLPLLEPRKKDVPTLDNRQDLSA